MRLVAARCTACGGSLGAAQGQQDDRCPFCGRTTLTTTDEAVALPEVVLPFAVDDTGAQEHFRRFATRGFFRPSDLRQATLELDPVFIPSWAFSGDVDLHWAAKARSDDSTEVLGVQLHLGFPYTFRSGREHVRVQDVFLPASRSITVAEMTALGAFDLTALAPFDAGTTARWETSSLGAGALRRQAHEVMVKRAGQLHARSVEAILISSSGLVTDEVSMPVFVPVYLGAYRYKDRLYRIAIHGQTGKTTGKTPVSVARVLAVVGVLVSVLVLPALFAVCTGFLMAFAQAVGA